MAQRNGKAAEQMDGHLDGHKEEQTDGVRRHRIPCVAHSLRKEEDEEPEDIVSSTFITIHTLIS